jgi:beta-glucosidase-like glycosyl hydrolase
VAVPIDALVARLDLERKVRLLTAASAWTTHEEPAVGLRAMVLSDGPAGVRGQAVGERDTAASLPAPTALAATWDEALVERLGRLLAAEARRKHADVLLGPTVNLQRTPLGGRYFECLSEDPLLSARIGAAYVGGVQAAVDDKVRRLLLLAARVGALAGVEPVARPPRRPAAGAVAALLREAAAGSVLVRNQAAALPRAADGLRRVAVVGPNAAVARTQGGGCG